MWSSTAADINIMKRRTEVCDRCDKLRHKVRIARTEESLTASTEQLTQHLQAASDERTHYNDVMTMARDSLAEAEDGGDPSLTHLTFDFAQNIELSFHTRQITLQSTAFRSV